MIKVCPPMLTPKLCCLLGKPKYYVRVSFIQSGFIIQATKVFFDEVDKADEFFKGLLDQGIELLGYEYEY